ncbi:hypothetical protein F383_25071 [Gossypium arboreum]|uniref:Uncharacterized protein n=1 Tax=Gossypium arboreum TaxID=29729 RepID=A0A0B0P7Z8_GOSAR|nr:hypothetical protein F383_25071 [Gossypium arboreum]
MSGTLASYLISCKTLSGKWHRYLVTCKTTSKTLALYELSKLFVYPYDSEWFNGHSKK